jgi:hypothetical protein
VQADPDRDHVGHAQPPFGLAASNHLLAAGNRIQEEKRGDDANADQANSLVGAADLAATSGLRKRLQSERSAAR